MKKIIFLIPFLFIAIVILGIVVYRQRLEIQSKNDEVGNLEEKVKMLQDELSEIKMQDIEEKRRALAAKKKELESKINENKMQLNRRNEIVEGVGNGMATVIYRKEGCDYFIMENSSGCIVAEWFGGHDPDINDQITGSLSSFGFKDLFDKTADSDCRFWIDDYMLSKEDAIEKIKEQCN